MPWVGQTQRSPGMRSGCLSCTALLGDACGLCPASSNLGLCPQVKIPSLPPSGASSLSLQLSFLLF